MPQDIPFAVQVAARHLSVSAAQPVEPAAFLEALRVGGPGLGAVGTFLWEAEPDEIADLVACGAASFSRLAEIAAATLPRSHPNRVWLDQLSPRNAAEPHGLA